MITALIRRALRVIPDGTRVRVVRGPLRGARWIVGSTPNSAWLGTLEPAMLADFAARLRPGMVVWDVGANVGLYTLLAARRVGSTGQVVAFEPMPRNLALLQQHLALNVLGNVTVVSAAVGDHDGRLRMAEGRSPSEFHADPSGDITVPSVTLDSWRERTGARPADIVKIDVEGLEAEVLRGGVRQFTSARPVVYLALHGDEPRRSCGEMLGLWNYSIGPANGATGIESASEWLAIPQRPA